MNARSARLGEEIRKEVSDIIFRHVKDPRLGMVSITDVEVTRDLSYAKIFFSVLGDEQQRDQSTEGLTKATGFIRSELAKRIRVRHIPELTFVYDGSLEHGARINAILREIGPGGEEK